MFIRLSRLRRLYAFWSTVHSLFSNVCGCFNMESTCMLIWLSWLGRLLAFLNSAFMVRQVVCFSVNS